MRVLQTLVVPFVKKDLCIEGTSECTVKMFTKKKESDHGQPLIQKILIMKLCSASNVITVAKRVSN